MANSLTLDAYADHILVSVDSLTATYLIKRAVTSDIAHSDIIYSTAGVVAYEDDTVVQGHPYTYWITQADGSTIVTGPLTSRLFQAKLIGRGGGLKGSKRNKSWDYDVECPLCGCSVRRNTLRRGYVRPHPTGENYLPNAAAPENWTYGANAPVVHDINVSGDYYNEGYPYVFPQIEKDSDWRTPPGQNRWPGIPQIWTGWNTGNTLTIGTPTALVTGTIICWIYVQPGSGSKTVQIKQAAEVLLTVDLENLAQGWNRVTSACTATNAAAVYMTPVYVAGTQRYFLFGGAQLTSKIGHEADIEVLPHRSSAAGVYTTGGMMDLCTECYSGLRKRVPWG